MAEPARKRTHGEEQEPDDDHPVLLQRWVDRPDGSLELLEMPLTPEDFLDPQLGDKWLQERLHGLTVLSLFELLDRHLRPEEDIVVLSDTKHLLGSRRGPAPDVSVVRGALKLDLEELSSFDVTTPGIAVLLVIEVVSRGDARIRRTDEVDKVKLYERVGIPEYLLLDMPRRATDHRFRFKGYRLGPEGRYRLIEPDAEGFLLSETTHLRFGVSKEGDRVEVFDARTGEKLLSSWELSQAWKVAEQGRRAEEQARKTAEQARKAAEQGRKAEEQARKAEEQARKAAEQARKAAEKEAVQERAAREAAESELERLRAEIERLRSGR